MPKVGFVYDDIFLSHETPAWHPESKERLTRVVSVLRDAGMWDRLVHINPAKASLEDVAAVHTPLYIERIAGLGEACLDPETFVSAGTLNAVLYAVGGIFEAVQMCKARVVNRVFCAVRPPGHHAEADAGMGFCIFNNVAVGARFAQKVGYQKIMIIDFDAHHGNGTQHIFEEDDTVFYFSTHQFPYYPDTGKESERGRGRGKGFTYNVTIRAGSGNKDFIYVYQDLLPDLVRRFEPDMILVSAGYDIHVNDPHANMRVTAEGMRGIVRGILGSSEKPVVFVLEGGYHPPSLADSVRITIEEMLASE